MEWYNYLAAFFSGAFLANSVPHFIKGVAGDKFPTPFAKPPGKGLSPAYINVLWAGLNIIIGYLLLVHSKMQPENGCIGKVVFFVGAMVMALMLSKGFTQKHKE
ncbi:hypothetical protein [Mucilaginibacter sp.]